MAQTLSQLAKLVNATLVGDGSTVIENAVILSEAGTGDITLIDNVSRLDMLFNTQASAVVMPKSDLSVGLPALMVDDVHDAFTKIVKLFRPQRVAPQPFVSLQAGLDPTAKIGVNVTIYPFAYVGAEAEIGDNVVLHPHSCVMAGAKIGEGSVLYPGVVVHEDCVVGKRCILSAGASIGANGFGYKLVDGKHALAAQLGNVILGDDVDVGANTTIDRGAYGATRIGDGTKIDNQVMIGHNCQIGKHNLLCAQVGIAGSVTTGDYVVMAGQVGIRDHVHIGDCAILGAKCGVMNNIDPGAKMLGAPACPEREFLLKVAMVSKLPEFKKQIRDVDNRLKKLEKESDAKSQGQSET